MRRFQELLVWQKAHRLVLDIYQMTRRFPVEERYGLTSQIRRAAVSVPANVVEGHKRMSKRDFSNFMTIAESSLEEVKYYCLLSKDLGYVPEKLMQRLYERTEEVGRMLYGLKSHIRKEISNEKSPAL